MFRRSHHIQADNLSPNPTRPTHSPPSKSSSSSSSSSSHPHSHHLVHMDGNEKPVHVAIESRPLLDGEDQKEHAQQEGEKKSDMFWSIFNLANDIVGVGLLAAPHYIAQGGIGAVCMLVFFITLISDYTLRKLNHISLTLKQENFVELCDIAYGKVGYFLACLFMFVYNFGAAVANLMVIGTAVPELLSFVLEKDHFLTQREYVLLFSVILFLPVSFFKDIKDYAICSFIAVVGVITVVCVVFFRPILPPPLQADLIPPPPADAYDFMKPGMMHVLGGISFIFVCHDFSISISSSLQNPTPARWAIVVRASLMIGILCTLCIGLSGYFTFWNDVSQNILDNYPSRDIPATFARSLICLGIVVSVPYNVVMPRLAIRQLIELAWKPEGSDDLFHIIITLVVLSCELLVAITVTDLGNLFEFVGGFASAGLAFILPPLIYIKLEKGSLWHTPSKLAMLFITFFGVFTLVTSSSATVRRIWTVGE